MYVKQTPRPLIVTFSARVIVTLGFTGLLLGFAGSASAQQPQVIRNITEPTQRLEMTVNTSRILTLDKRVPKMVVNNPELVSVTPISANQVQIAAKKPGVTQINLWDEDDKVYTVDLLIYGDVRELEHALKRLFPESSVKVMRLTNSLVLEGFVERPEAVSPIIRLAEDYAPKIINNITVGGVQQILLKVKVMEVSRTKLRNLGVDWVQSSGTDFVTSGVSGLLSAVGTGQMGNALTFTRGGTTFEAFVADGNDAFLGLIDALQQNNVGKVLADPSLVTVSGRPASFHVGGEFAYILPGGIGQPPSVVFKDFGTKIDVMPIVLGNGSVRLEIRSEISEIDFTLGTSVAGELVPGLKTSNIDTGVEMKAGQTLALAGLVQTRIDAVERGLPFLSDLPLIGAAFRSVREEVNETELLILVTPEFAAGMDPHEVPKCGPGMESVSPSNNQLYWGGHLEVPACGPCGPNARGAVNAGCQSCNGNVSAVGSAYISDGVPTPAVMGGTMQLGPTTQVQPLPPYFNDSINEPINTPSPNAPGPSLELPPQTPPAEPIIGPEPAGAGPLGEPTAYRHPTAWSPSQASPTAMQNQSFQNPYSQLQLPATAQRPRTGTSTPGLMGPIGYDVEK